MKRPTQIYGMLALCIFLNFSCNKEELFVEDLVQEEVIDETENTEEESSNEDIDAQPEEVDPTQPCELSLEALIADLTDNIISINCFMDLEGKTVNLPPNIQVAYEGGEIKNGTLVFAGGTIDGELLDISLKLQGELTLSSPEYTFAPSKWNIVEGKTTSEIALQNRKNMNQVLELVKELEGHVFEIEQLDAYFDVGANKVNRKYCTERAIRIPSDFHFKMNEETFLRVQPTHYPAYTLLAAFRTDNSIISGGNLIGDRWEHDYTPIIDVQGVNRREHGWGHLIWLMGAHNVTVDGVYIKDAIGEGINVHAETIREPDGTFVAGKRTSENVVIKNTTVDECRRNGMAVVDANGVIIENCNILNTAQGEPVYDANGEKVFSSAGTQPRYGIDLEALRYINDDGTMNEINRVSNVTIRNSRFKGGAFGDIDLYTCNNVIVENNIFDKWVASKAANDIIIRNNTFESAIAGDGFAINIKSYKRKNSDVEFNYNYLITGNKIERYDVAIMIGGKNQEIKNNILTDNINGIMFRHDFVDSSLSGNIIKSSVPNSNGYKCRSNQNTSNVFVKNESIDVMHRPIILKGFNSESEVSEGLVDLTFEECTFNTDNVVNFPILIEESKNVEFNNNTSNTDFLLMESENIVLTNNSMNQ